MIAATEHIFRRYSRLKASRSAMRAIVHGNADLETALKLTGE